MIDYNATIELDTTDMSDAVVDAVMHALREHHPAITNSPEGRVTAIITLHDQDARSAAATAGALARTTGHELIALEVLPTVDFDARSGLDAMSVTEAADALGVSRQAVLQLVNRGTLAASKVGEAWVIPRSVVAQRAMTHPPRSTEQRLREGALTLHDLQPAAEDRREAPAASAER